MDFDSLDLLTVPVTIAGKKYTLREIDTQGACRYNNAKLHGTKFDENGKAVGIGNLADVEPLLVSLCLFEDGQPTHVPLSVVSAWPYRVVKPLFDKAKEISHLDEREKAKNSPAATTDVSA